MELLDSELALKVHLLAEDAECFANVVKAFDCYIYPPSIDPRVPRKMGASSFRAVS